MRWQKWSGKHWLKRNSAGLLIVSAITALAALLQSIETSLLGHPVIEGVALAIVIGMLVRTFTGDNRQLLPGD